MLEAQAISLALASSAKGGVFVLRRVAMPSAAQTHQASAVRTAIARVKL